MKQINRSQIEEGMKLFITNKDSGYDDGYLICNIIDEEKIMCEEVWALTTNGVEGGDKKFFRTYNDKKFEFIDGDRFYVLTDEEWVGIKARVVLEKLRKGNLE